MAAERLGDILPLVIPLVLALNRPPAVVPAISVYYTHSTERLIGAMLFTSAVILTGGVALPPPDCPCLCLASPGPHLWPALALHLSPLPWLVLPLHPRWLQRGRTSCIRCVGLVGLCSIW